MKTIGTNQEKVDALLKHISEEFDRLSVDPATGSYVALQLFEMIALELIKQHTSNRVKLLRILDRTRESIAKYRTD